MNKVWLETTRTRLSGRSDVASAIRYALSRWSGLTRHGEDGTIAIDNNPVERAMRPVALGRKNWLLPDPTPAASALPRSTA